MLLLVSFLMFFFLSETLSKVGMVLKTFPFIVWSSALKPSLRLLNFHNFECNFTYPVSLNFHCLFFFPGSSASNSNFGQFGQATAPPAGKYIRTSGVPTL